jgi:DNA-binding CsgD family transcriptional regulator
VAEVAAAIRALPAPAEPPSVTDGLLDAAAQLIDAGYAVGAPGAHRALDAFRAASLPPAAELRWMWLACRLAHGTWDDDAWDALSARFLEVVRGAGVLALLPLAVAMRVGPDLFAGDLGVAAARIPERDAVADATGGERSPTAEIALAAFRGDEAEVARLDAATTQDALARGEGQWLAARHWATAVLFNGRGRYAEALVAAQQGAAHPPDLGLVGWALCELVEAAARTGQPDAAGDALERLGIMARACGTDWVLGVEARARALMAEGDAAEDRYCAAIDHLGRTRLRTEVARAHLVYGEWLRRAGRRVDAREHLREAHDLLASMGAAAFAERARRELVATGEHVRSRSAGPADELTAQESEIARLAASGHTNPEIGARLFLSPRTVEWHLRKVFVKLEITSRNQLREALTHQETVAAAV